MLLATDMDGTVLPATLDDDARATIARFAALLRGAPALRLAYVTGRHFGLAREGIEEAGLPEPDWLACDVGTSVYARADGAWTRDAGYRERMRGILGDDGAARIDAAVLSIPGLSLQPAARQGEFKRSFDAEPSLDLRVVRARVERALAEGGVAGEVVASRDPADGVGLVDVLPRGVAKGTAVEHLRVVLGLTPREVVYAGDSGNDEAALLAGWRGIVVPGARAEWIERLRGEAVARGLADRVYFARTPCTGGVIEGARHFGVIA